MRLTIRTLLLMLLTAFPGLAQVINTGTGSTDCVGGGTMAAPVTATVASVPTGVTQAQLQTEWYGTFVCTVSGLTAGTQYSVGLVEDEIYWSAAGQRKINVAINGQQVLKDYDIFAAAGGKNIAVMPTFTAMANAQGQIVVSFLAATVDQSKINAIVVTPVLVVAGMKYTVTMTATMTLDAKGTPTFTNVVVTAVKQP